MGTPPVIFAKGPGLVLCSGGCSGRWSFKGWGGAWTAELKNARQLKAPPPFIVTQSSHADVGDKA